MGMMYFPGEKVNEYLPPRDDDGDCVGKFGAWLTRKGALSAYYISVVVLLACVAIKLVLWIIKCFNNNIFYGILSVIGAWFIGLICTYVSIGIALLVAALVWLFGWVCYNKWTLFICFILSLLWYYLSSDGKGITESVLLWFEEFPFVAWEWYKNVL